MSYGISAFSETAFASLGGGIANANGQNINTNQGSITVDLNTPVNVTGQPLTVAQGDVSIFAGVIVIPTGIDLTTNSNSNPESTLGTPDLTVSSVNNFSAPSATEENKIYIPQLM
jgi:hypothetical protein